MVFIAGLLLCALTLTPASSFAGNDHHQGRRNAESHQINKEHAENNRNRHNPVSHHMKYKHSHYRKHKRSDHGKHRNRHYNQPHYVLINNRSERSGIQIGLHSGNFGVIFRD